VRTALALAAERLMLFKEEFPMFKHILLPTDGSPLSEAAIAKGISFAKSIGARVTGFHVISPFHLLATGVEMVTDTKEQYEAYSRAQADAALAVVARIAKLAGVVFECISETNSQPFESIIQAAAKRGCDLIVMASHGRRGVQGLLIGSETNKVLTHTKTPVLVLH
jgi:nucleotide-binding universal stress UspA family protein